MTESTHPLQFTSLPVAEVPLFSDLDRCIAGKDPKLSPFYRRPAVRSELHTVVAEKKRNYTQRETLVELLQTQYPDWSQVPAALQSNLEKLTQPDSFCIVTAHQPLLFGGHLYFVYKALSAIATARSASEEIDGSVVPVFVLGTEDHDYEEVRHAHLFSETLTWESGSDGPVGRMPVGNLPDLMHQVRGILGRLPEGSTTMALLEESLQGADTFAAFNRQFLHQLFGHLGLIVLDLDTVSVKRAFAPIIRRELLDHVGHTATAPTLSALAEAGITSQAHVRPINLFYLEDGVRTRLIQQEDGSFATSDNTRQWTESEILELVDTNPRAFSPNVILRPVLQEFILPNLAYIGGGGELAYWLQLGDLFDKLGVSFPLLVRRHSGWLLDPISQEKMAKTGIDIPQLFREEESVVQEYVHQQAADAGDLERETQQVLETLAGVREKCKAIDPTLEGSYNAVETQIVKQLQILEGKMTRGLKNRHDQEVRQIRNLFARVHPQGNVQERYENILPWLARYGRGWLDEMLGQMLAFQPELIIVRF